MPLPEDNLSTFVPPLLDTLRAQASKPHNDREFDGLHDLPLPDLPKRAWTLLGDHLKTAEASCLRVPGNRWISLRLDGCSFGKFVRKCRRSGLFAAHGYSPEFENLMLHVCEALAMRFGAKCAYTQSDEITLLLPPMPVNKHGGQITHLYNGRSMKLCSVAASYATSCALKFLMRISVTKALNANALDDVDAVFDCRVGSYATQEEAFSLILWRAYDCGVNGVGGAVNFQRGTLQGAKHVEGLPTPNKLRWLKEHDLLPLVPHQAYGTFFAKVHRVREAFNPKTGEAVTCRRQVLESSSSGSCVLNRYLAGSLFPKDDPET